MVAKVKPRRWFCVLIMIFALGNEFSQAATQVMGEAKGTSQGAPFSYLLYSPTDSPKNPKPLILYLHGAGERGADLARLREHGPPKLLAEGTFPLNERDFFLVAPQCPRECNGWPVDQLIKFVQGLIRSYPIDPTRVVVTGQSMGGIGTIELLAAKPNFFAGGVALCGKASKDVAPHLVWMPLWLLHGERDDVIPVSGSRDLYAWIKAKGGKQVIYDELAGQGHMIHNDVYQRAAVWDWLLKKQRGKSS